MKKIFVAIIFSLCFSLAAGAQSVWMHDYTGTVGNSKIGLTLVSNSSGEFERGDDVSCSYFYESQLKDISLNCEIAANGSFVFKEFDERGRVRATFKGRFVKNKTDLAEGTWTRAGRSKSLPFRMSYLQGVGAQDGNRYEQINAKDPLKFETMVRDLRTSVLNANKQKVVAQIRYPISVMVGGKKVRVRNRVAMLTYYDRVFDKGFVEKVKAAVPHNMFTRDQGAMLGQGIIWFWGDGKVIAINN